MDKIVLFLKKLLTVVVDRRALVAAAMLAMIALLPVFGVSPDDVAKLSEAGNEILAGVVLLLEAAVKLAGAVAVILGLLASWGVRPPSGLKF